MLSLFSTYYQPTLALLNFLSSRIPVGERANSSRIVVGSAQTTYTHIPGISYLRCTANKPFLKNSYSGNSTPTPHYVPYQIRVTRVCRVRTFSLSTIVIGNIYIVDLWYVRVDLWYVSFWISVTIRPTMGQPTTPKKTSGIFDSRTLFPYQNKNFTSVKVLSWFKLGQQSCVVVFHLHSPHVCTNTNPSGSCARSGTVGKKPCQSNVWEIVSANPQHYVSNPAGQNTRLVLQHPTGWKSAISYFFMCLFVVF